MITVSELKDRMQEPFHPFRLHTTDGKSYDVTNHDMMFIKRNGVEMRSTWMTMRSRRSSQNAPCSTLPVLKI
jgi:hypothetical protein